VGVRRKGIARKLRGRGCPNAERVDERFDERFIVSKRVRHLDFLRC